MAAAEITVDINRIDQMTEDMAGHIVRMREGMNDLIEEIKSFDSMWDGIASMAFFQQFGKDCRTLLDFCDYLQTFCECNDEAAKKYLDNERQLNDAVRGLNTFVL